MIALWTLLANPAAACPETLDTAVRTVEDARAAREAARDELYATDWNFRLATEDRDAVLAEMEAAREALKAARAAVRDARKQLADVRVASSAGDERCKSS